MTAPRNISRADLDELKVTHRLVPITRTLFADAETPVGVYRKLAAGRPGTFLLESAEAGASFSRWSFVGVDAVASLSVADDRAVWTGRVPDGVPTDGDPLAGTRRRVASAQGPRLPGLPPLTGGFVGYLGYDVVRRIETLPDKAVDDLGLPELTMLLVTDLAAVDHFECTVVLIANAIVHPEMTAADLDAAYADAVRRLDAMQAALDTPSESTVATVGPADPKEAVSRTPRAVPAVGGACARGDPRRRGVPDPGGATLRRRDERRPAGRVPRAAHAQSLALHVLPAHGRRRHRRLQPGGAGDGDRGQGRPAPDRRHPQAGRDG